MPQESIKTCFLAFFSASWYLHDLLIKKRFFGPSSKEIEMQASVIHFVHELMFKQNYTWNAATHAAAMVFGIHVSKVRDYFI
tara:strand:+ start:3430 stop:3675 length:246 start_codon:yes stop_codon:yes gene_type:complete